MGKDRDAWGRTGIRGEGQGHVRKDMKVWGDATGRYGANGFDDVLAL